MPVSSMLVAVMAIMISPLLARARHASLPRPSYRPIARGLAVGWAFACCIIGPPRCAALESGSTVGARLGLATPRSPRVSLRRLLVRHRRVGATDARRKTYDELI